MIAHISGDQHRYLLTVAALSAQGGRATNEDYLGMLDMGERGSCFALADGAGGHGNGALAARLTVDAVLEGYRDNPLFAPAGLGSLISRAEQVVCTEQPVSVSRQHMCATVVLLCIEPVGGRALWAHWGDSRLYCFRGNKLHRMTEDHSLVQQLLHAGIYQQADLRQLPNRNVLAGAIGAESQVPPTVLAQAMDLEPGDVFLLCSDGLWENLQEAEMEAALCEAERADEWLEQMKTKVLAAGKPNQDNLSALTLWVSAPEAPV